MLYVKEKPEELSSLAHEVYALNKFRPETCCVVGNYFSMKQDHETAIQYFERALRVNRKYLSAWTLMGHEYVEMKSTRLAAECYRIAVTIDPRDYRAWYGLGQTFELLSMPLFALHYYRYVAAGGGCVPAICVVWVRGWSMYGPRGAAHKPNVTHMTAGPGLEVTYLVSRWLFTVWGVTSVGLVRSCVYAAKPLPYGRKTLVCGVHWRPAWRHCKSSTRPSSVTSAHMPMQIGTRMPLSPPHF